MKHFPTSSTGLFYYFEMPTFFVIIICFLSFFLLSPKSSFEKQTTGTTAVSFRTNYSHWVLFFLDKIHFGIEFEHFLFIKEHLVSCFYFLNMLFFCLKRNTAYKIFKALYKWRISILNENNQFYTINKQGCVLKPIYDILFEVVL